MDFQQPAFIPQGQQNKLMDRLVWWVDVVGHERLPQRGNHWCLYLRTDENKSVCVDIIPSSTVPSTSIAGGSKANMIISSSEYGIPSSAQKAVRLDIPHGRKASDFVNLLIEHGRHKYEFNGLGEGCRYWTSDQIDLFHQHDLLVNQAQIEEAQAAILTQWPDQMRYPLVQGSYYE